MNKKILLLLFSAIFFGCAEEQSLDSTPNYDGSFYRYVDGAYYRNKGLRQDDIDFIPGVLYPHTVRTTWDQDDTRALIYFGVLAGVAALENDVTKRKFENLP